MDRRGFIAALGAIGLGGCTGRLAQREDATRESSPTPKVETKVVTKTVVRTRVVGFEQSETPTAIPTVPQTPTTTSAPTATPTATRARIPVLDFGEEKERDGLRITVNDVTKVETIRPSGGITEIRPKDGSIHLLVNVEVSHVGGGIKIFPTVLAGDIRMRYDGRRINGKVIDSNFQSGGKGYRSYTRQVEKTDGDQGAYSGANASGWVPFEVPKSFDRSEATVVIGWDEGDDRNTFQWKLE